MPFAHIAGIPVEETLLGLGPFGLAGVGALVAYGSQRARDWRHPRRRGDDATARHRHRRRAR